MNRSSRFGAAMALATLVGAAACGGDDPVEVVSESLLGSYELLSITFEGQPTATPPYVTGTLTLASSSYEVRIDAVTPDGPMLIEDAGTYEAAGAAWVQNTGDGLLVEGTYEFDGEFLHTDVVQDGSRVLSSWRKM